MAKLKVDQFVDLVKRSGLVDNERLTQALSGIDESVKDSGIVASSLTKAGLLTEWQSEKLLQGRHKGFYLGKYKLLNHIGTGGMGSVYLAEHCVMRHRVAIKLLPNHLAAHTSYLERFHQEARASAQLNHPNMVRAHDVDHDENLHYLVMDYVEGQDLQAIVSRNGPLPYRTAGDYIRQAADGLAYAHRAGLIHRDIKPQNILIDNSGVVKILDMGLARFTDESQASLTREYDQKMIGTVDYLAPEQAIDSHKVDARADIYSLGCTLYFLLTGDAPFPQGTIPQRLMQHQSADPSDIRKVRPDAPQELIDICRKMMSKRADDRYQSADEVSQVFAEWLGIDVGPGTAAYERSPPPAQREFSRNEDLTLAPIEDEPVTRAGKHPGDDTKGSGSKIGGSKSGIRKDSPIKKPGSGVKSGPMPALKNGEHAPASKTDSSAGKAGAKPKPPASAPPLGAMSKPKDLMDELLSAPALPPTEPLPAASPLTAPRRCHTYDAKTPIWMVVGMGLLGAGVIFGLLLLLIWQFSGF